MKETAVEWLKEQLECFGNKHELQMSWDTVDDLFEQAKTMEKEQRKELPTWDDVKKAIQMAREIKDDSAHDTFTVEDIAGCTEVCTYGWREKYTDEQIIEGLKKEKAANEKD